MKATHHELCFGCGLANVFGLGLEAERDDAGVVRGRFFVKQDHQGPGGTAHPGVLAAALIEAMSLAQERGQSPFLQVSIDVQETPPVGSFVMVEASPDSATLRGESLAVLASARSG